MRLWTAVLVLVAAVLACYAAAVVGWGRAVLVPATLAAAITLPPVVGTLVGVVKVTAVKPDFGPIAALAATFVRMIWAVGVVALLRGRAAEYGTTPDDIAGWTVGFYLLTLFVETALLWRLLNRPATPRGTADDGSVP